MSGPTGFEPGGARTLRKDPIYTPQDVPPEGYPSPENVFRAIRTAQQIQIDFVTDDNAPLSYDITNPDGSSYSVYIPAWSGQPTFTGNPVGPGSIAQ